MNNLSFPSLVPGQGLFGTCTFLMLLSLPSYSSIEMDRFMDTLDNRLDQSSKGTTGLVAKKIRKVGSFSTTTAPSDAPTWAVRRGMHF